MDTEETTCRLCLTPWGTLSLFDKDGEVQYSALLMRWTSLVLSADDGLPSRICPDCAALLCSASEFLARCEASDKRLRSEQPLKIKGEEFHDISEEIKREHHIYLDQTYLDEPRSTTSDNEQISKDNCRNVPDETDNTSDFDVKTRPNLTHQPRRVRRKRRREKERVFQCGHCEESYKTNRALITHIASHHQRQREFTCETCGSRFYTKAILLRHQLIHTGVKPSQCQLCGKAFLAKIFLNQHMKNHTSERKYICHLCDKAFKTKHGLTKHINKTMTHSNAKLKRVSCNICNITFSVKSSLTTHIKKKHSENLGP